jgi:hypothetical protein
VARSAMALLLDHTSDNGIALVFVRRMFHHDKSFLVIGQAAACENNKRAAGNAIA